MSLNIGTSSRMNNPLTHEEQYRILDQLPREDADRLIASISGDAITVIDEGTARRILDKYPSIDMIVPKAGLKGSVIFQEIVKNKDYELYNLECSFIRESPPDSFDEDPRMIYTNYQNLFQKDFEICREKGLLFMLFCKFPDSLKAEYESMLKMMVQEALDSSIISVKVDEESLRQLREIGGPSRKAVGQFIDVLAGLLVKYKSEIGLELHLDGLNLSHEQVEKLVEACSGINLSALRLPRAGLTTEDVLILQKLWSGERKFPLIWVDLLENKIDEKGLAPLLQLKRQFPRVKIDVRKNMLSEEAVESLKGKRS